MSNGLMHSTLKAGLASARPTVYPGDMDFALYFATDENALFIAPKPATGSVAAWRGAGGATKVLTDADVTLTASDSGRTFVVPNVSADRTITLPALADSVGASFEFIAQVGAADGHDWIFATAATDELFAGGVLSVDTDAGPATVAAVVADQSNDDAFQVNLPQGGTRVRITNDGTFWTVTGTVVSAAAPAFS